MMAVIAATTLMSTGCPLHSVFSASKAIPDKKERIRVLPNDVVMLHQKPGYAFFNVFLNYFRGDSILISAVRGD